MAEHDDESYLTDNDGDDEYAPRSRKGEGRSSGGRPEAHRGVLILVFGILGIVFCPIFGIFAWIWGNEDMPKFKSGRMEADGEGMTQAGRVLGIIACCLIFLWIAIFGLAMCGALVGGGAASSNM
jgi:hypothetical protein